MTNLFPILSIETSGDLCSVCVTLDEKEFAEINVERKHIHSELLLSLIDQCVSNAGINKNQLNSIAVSMGPGSFTGLRIGLTVAKSLAFGLNLPIIPVPTFNALAFGIYALNPSASNIAIVNKVNRDELYFQQFTKDQIRNSSEIQLVKTPDFEKINFDGSFYGNYKSDKVVNFGSPRASDIGKWTYFFGQDLVTFDHDYLEPNYVKNFIAKVKR